MKSPFGSIEPTSGRSTLHDATTGVVVPWSTAVSCFVAPGALTGSVAPAGERMRIVVVVASGKSVPSPASPSGGGEVAPASPPVLVGVGVNVWAPPAPPFDPPHATAQTVTAASTLDSANVASRTPRRARARSVPNIASSES